jgi:DDE family transposase
MSADCLSLLSVLAEVPDPRGRRGKRHPLSATLALAVAATLCGYRSYGAIAEWGRNYGPALIVALGFTRPKTPCAAALFLLFQRLDRERLEAALGRWAEAMLARLPPRDGELEPLAIDGKTVRGAKQQGALNVHLLSVLSHRLGLTLAQHAVPDHTNEITAIQTVLQMLLLEGRVVTVDALLCQREIAQTIVEKGGTTS